MATLKQVVDELKKNRETSEETRDAVASLNSTFTDYFTFLDRNRLDELENRRELLDVLKGLRQPAPAADTGQSVARENTLVALGLLGGLTKVGALLSGITVLVAELTDLDAALRALAIPRLISSITSTFRSISNSINSLIEGAKNFGARVVSFVDAVRTFNYSDYIPKIVIPEETRQLFNQVIVKNVTEFFDSISNSVTNARSAASLSLTSFVDTITTKIADLTRPITEAIDTIRLNIDTFKTNIVLKVNNLLSPITTAFDTLSTNVSAAATTIAKYIPSIEIPQALRNIQLPDMQSIMTRLGDLIGVAGTVDAPGTGIVGFLTGIVSGLQKIPGIGLVVKTILRPFTQILLTVFDFVQGFYEGFTSEVTDEFGRTRPSTFTDKVLAGLEGGFLGVIKGFTEALDLLFIKLPAWLLEKIGLTSAAELLKGFSLTDMVDPIWSGIKGIFKFFTSDSYRDEKIAEFKIMFDETIDGFIEWFRSLFDFLPSVEEVKQKLSDLVPSWLKSSPEVPETFTENNPLGIPGASFEKGTQGNFLNFGAGTPAVLHGYEAVVPRESSEGRILTAVRTKAVADVLTGLAYDERQRQIMAITPIVSSNPTTNIAIRQGDMITGSAVRPPYRRDSYRFDEAIGIR